CSGFTFGMDHGILNHGHRHEVDDSSFSKYPHHTNMRMHENDGHLFRKVVSGIHDPLIPNHRLCQWVSEVSFD
ncbi:hypothetical protein AVEN_216975-1, partial [Araneus ventricosus]